MAAYARCGLAVLLFSRGAALCPQRRPVRGSVARPALSGPADADDSLPHAPASWQTTRTVLRLPCRLNWRSDNGTRDGEFALEARPWAVNPNGTAIVRSEPENPYYQIVSSLAPADIIGRFAETAPAAVQDAVRSTIVGLLGSASGFAIDTATANLMFQLQMTGYMFKNAEYRMSLAQSLGDGWVSKGALPPSSEEITVDFGGHKISVDADAYMLELRNEVRGLRSELAKAELEQAAAAQRDLLKYISQMPPPQMEQLTSDVSDEVLDGMKKLVTSIMRSMGTANVKPDTLLQQSGSAMTQLLLWQMVIGYNLRELEVRDQFEGRLRDD